MSSPATCQRDGDAARPRRRGAVHVLHVGTAHSVAGPAIRNADIVMRRGRIVAVGKHGEVEVPEGAQTTDYPDAHAYPGLVDALSVAFGDKEVLQDKTSDAGTPIYRGLDPYDETSRELVSQGITTAYISNRGETTWRGLGTIVHPRSDGFARPRDKAESTAAVQMRISGGDAKAHPLARQKALRNVDKPFEALEDFRKKKEEYEKARKEYDEKFEAYLAYFRKKKGGEDKKAGGETQPGGGAKSDGGERRGRRRGGASRGGKPPAEKKPSEGGKGGSGESAEKNPAQDGKAEPETEKPGDKKPGDKKPGEKAPERPKFPKAPDPDPAKEALLRVVDDGLPLRVEADREDEIRTALALARQHDVRSLILEGVWHGARAASEIAGAGVPVVTTGFLPASADPNDEELAALPAKLAAAGVEVAIGSGSVRTARNLTLLAAYAVGHGLAPDAAVAALTLAPAKILGIQKQVGTLEAGKRADVVLTSGPLLDSDSRILAVYSGGEVQFEAKR